MVLQHQPRRLQHRRIRIDGNDGAGHDVLGFHGSAPTCLRLRAARRRRGALDPGQGPRCLQARLRQPRGQHCRAACAARAIGLAPAKHRVSLARLTRGNVHGQQRVDRRTVSTAHHGARPPPALLPRAAFAQPALRPSLPARGEFVVRGAHVLSMDDKIGDLPSGDVHVRDGAIVAVAASVNAPGAQAHRRQGHDLHARLRRHALAPLDDASCGR